MRILFLLNPSFLRREKREPTLFWLDRYASAIETRGHTVKRFDPLTDKVRDFDLIHVFSPGEPELWSVLAGLGFRVVVTPSLAAEAPDLRGHRLVRVVRALLQRRWPPVDEASFANTVQRYFVVSGQWQDALERAWGVPAARISRLPLDPKAAAGLMAGLLEAPT